MKGLPYGTRDIVRVIGERPGASGAEIWAALRKRYPKSTLRPHELYPNLTSLTRQGRVEREHDGDVYRYSLAAAKEEK